MFITMRLPEWIKTKHNPSALQGVRGVLREYGLATVCEEARCPNKPACFSKPTATFMILGARCTRGCGFCSVESRTPLEGLEPPDADEPLKVALAAKQMGLKYVVVTSVTRDDLSDGGAGQFALTIKAIRRHLPNAKVEVLVPDFGGDFDALDTVLDAGPEVFGHNIETVASLYPAVRPQAGYRRSLGLLRRAKEVSPSAATKSGLMLGLGETISEVMELFGDLRDAGCDFLTIGQYLRPAKENLPVREYVAPPVFERLRGDALEMGFRAVASAPLVRSSMNAEEMFEGCMNLTG